MKMCIKRVHVRSSMSSMEILPKRQKCHYLEEKLFFFCFLCIIAIFKSPIHMFVNFYVGCEFCFKPCTHDQICIYAKFAYVRKIWPCVRIYSRMQNLHVCKSWKICTCLRPTANLILHIRKMCVYANLVM